MQHRMPTLGVALPRFEGLFSYLADLCESMGSSARVLMHVLYTGGDPV